MGKNNSEIDNIIIKNSNARQASDDYLAGKIDKNQFAKISYENNTDMFIATGLSIRLHKMKKLK